MLPDVPEDASLETLQYELGVQMLMRDTLPPSSATRNADLAERQAAIQYLERRISQKEYESAAQIPDSWATGQWDGWTDNGFAAGPSHVNDYAGDASAQSYASDAPASLDSYHSSVLGSNSAYVSAESSPPAAVEASRKHSRSSSGPSCDYPDTKRIHVTAGPNDLGGWEAWAPSQQPQQTEYDAYGTAPEPHALSWPANQDAAVFDEDLIARACDDLAAWDRLAAASSAQQVPGSSASNGIAYHSMPASAPRSSAPTVDVVDLTADDSSPIDAAAPALWPDIGDVRHHGTAALNAFGAEHQPAYPPADPFAELDAMYTHDQTGGGPTLGQYSTNADIQAARNSGGLDGQGFVDVLAGASSTAPAPAQAAAPGPSNMNDSVPHRLAVRESRAPDPTTSRTGASSYEARIHEGPSDEGMGAIRRGSMPWWTQDETNDEHVAPAEALQEDDLNKLFQNIRPDEDVPQADRERTPAGMRTELMEHQKLGLAWLKQMEEGTNKGGILADDMGLGKTIQALALVLSRPSENPACKTTLIVAPVALMRQWEHEIKVKVRAEHRLSVHVYHGAGINADFKKLSRFDIVLTTFGTLASEYRKKDQYYKNTDLDDLDGPNANPPKLSLIGPGCKWYRIIIDEAQCIKNQGTHTSRASNELKAQYRLCMSGTPIMNRAEELYPLVRFLRVPPYCEWGRFNFDIVRPLKSEKNRPLQEKGLHRLRVLLKSIMLRRTKESLIDGHPIITIPPKRVERTEVVFSEDEEQFYTALQDRAALTFNRYMDRGTVQSNYTSMLVLLLRLRQACCHPHLIRGLDVQPATEGIAEDKLLDHARQLRGDVVARLKEQDGFECPICFDGTNNPTILVPCGHTTCAECFAKLFDPSKLIRAGDDGGKARCHTCRAELTAGKITDYAHFCKIFLPDAVADEDDGSSDCDSESDSDDLDGFVVRDDEDDDSASGSRRRSKKAKGKAPAKKRRTLAQLKQEARRSKAAKRKYLNRLRRRWETSAKIERTLALLAEIERNDPTEKTIIFSQFTSLLDLVEVPLVERGTRYTRLDGTMSPNDRASAVHDFMEDEQVKVMLVSLKAGNAGLNLTRASRIILLDPFWNPFIEDQAVDRAHRIMQQRNVTVHRVLVPNTIEDRIQTLQSNKRELVSAALDENASANLSRLSIRDLMYLFVSFARSACGIASLMAFRLVKLRHARDWNRHFRSSTF